MALRIGTASSTWTLKRVNWMKLYFIDRMKVKTESIFYTRDDLDSELRWSGTWIPKKPISIKQALDFPWKDRSEWERKIRAWSSKREQQIWGKSTTSLWRASEGGSKEADCRAMRWEPVSQKLFLMLVCAPNETIVFELELHSLNWFCLSLSFIRIDKPK